MNNQNLSILISLLNWNNATDTAKAIDSVLQLDYNSFELIVIDNASTDNSVEQLRNSFPDLKIIKSKKNRGYAGGHKIAATYALKNHFSAIWILNNDIEALPGSLTNIVKAWQQNGEALYGCFTLKPDRKTISFGGGAEMIDKKNIDRNSGYNHLNGKNYSEHKSNLQTKITSDINGAAFLIPVSIIRKYGFIDTRWFLYGEETDYCHRLRRKHHIPSYIVPDSVVIHAGSATLNKYPHLSLLKDYYFTRNINILYKKHFKNYKITNFGGYGHLLKFFIKHYLFNKSNRMPEYLKSYYIKLGQVHSLLRIRGKYLNPEYFIHD